MCRNNWKYSEILYLKINYGKISYKKMLKWMGKHSEKTISNKAVSLGISNKRNWSEKEIEILRNNSPKIASKIINRSVNACKIKKSRLCIR